MSEVATLFEGLRATFLDRPKKTHRRERATATGLRLCVLFKQVTDQFASPLKLLVWFIFLYTSKFFLLAALCCTKPSGCWPIRVLTPPSSAYSHLHFHNVYFVPGFLAHRQGLLI
jgi:hypothetical protein